MASKHLLPKHPKRTYVSEFFEDSQRGGLNVELDKMFCSAPSQKADSIVPTPKRSFKKSRKGCRTCKARKVKCDEKHPLCGNCSRRYPGLARCDFEHFIEVAPKKSESTSTSIHRAISSSIGPSITIQPTGISHLEGSRVLELRLMHHYTTSTCKQLPDGNSPQANYVWSIDIPQLAFQSDLVLNALLGISALHHWALAPNDPILSFAAEHYFDKAVKNHRMALSDVDQASAECVLATAILITHHTWLAGHSATSNVPYEIPLQTYYMARGIQALFHQMWPWLAGSGYLWYVNRTPITDTEEVPCVDPFLVSGQEDLTILSATFDEKGVTLADKVMYEKTVAELLSMYLAICNRSSQVPLQRMVATMPLRLPERFLQLVDSKDPRALALLARNLALLKVIDSAWWLHGTGPSQQVDEIAVAGIANMLPVQWAWVMEWPNKVLSGEFRPSNRVVG